eukprot:GFKZ01003754.1.p1 GENE.GFKZ01003754.1~~GFKZ01003754.1.p1  ORF type:complete len:1396 (-),score=287.32 GFKZ01003754.1:534-4721(-)
MTTIDRLGLIGIRSYGTDEETFIKFYRPLTIILGRNGSGKSTIIEAVKMATTGDLPPMVERGAAFIHDPRIHNETETKAKIRLMFTNVLGHQYIVARHFQLTIRKGPRGVGYKTEFKTGNQTVKRTDTDNASSFRCMDLNALLPDIMRVTKPVLNNVIFVHQEDSLWPLGDSNKLKAKLDEIFAATRYTKALDTIRKYRKDQASELKVVSMELLRYEDKVKVLEKIREKVDEIRVEHDNLKKGIDNLDHEIAQLSSEKKEALKAAQRYENLTRKLNNLKTEADIFARDKEDKYREMELHLTDMDDNALALEINELENFLERADGERSKRARLIDELSRDITNMRDEYNKRQNRRGQLEQQAKSRAELDIRLQQMKRDIKASNALSDLDNSALGSVEFPSESDGIESWTEALENIVSIAEANLTTVTRDTEKANDTALHHLNDIKDRVREARRDLKQSFDDVEAKKAEIATIRDELRNMDDCNGAIKEAESRLEGLERLYTEKKTSNRIRHLENQLGAQRKEASTTREDILAARRTRDQIMDNQKEQDRLESCQDEQKKKKRRVESVVEDISELISTAVTDIIDFGREEDVAEVKESTSFRGGLSNSNADERRGKLLGACSTLRARKDSMLREAESKRSETCAEVNALEKQRAEFAFKVNQTKRELRELLNDIRDRTKSVSAIPASPVNIDHVTCLFKDIQISPGRCQARARRDEVETVKDTIEEIDREVVKASQKITQIETGRLFAQMDLEAFEADPKHRCPACGMHSSKKEDEMRRKLTSRVENLKKPETKKKAEEDLRTLKRTSANVKKVHTTGVKAATLFESYETLCEKLETTTSSLQESRQKLAEVDSILDSLKGRFGDGSAVQQLESRDVELRQAFSEWERARKQLVEFQNSMPVTMADMRPLSEVEDQMRELEDQYEKLTQQIEKDSRALEREKEDLRRAESRLDKAKNKCLELKAMTEKNMRLKAEKEELAKSVRSLESEIETLKTKIKALSADREYAEEEHVTVRVEGKAALKKANEFLSRRNRDVDSWKDIVQSIDTYERSGKRKELERLIASLNGMQADIHSKEKDLRGHDKEQENASDSQKEIQSKIRNLKDNQKYRNIEQRLQVNARGARNLQDEIASLEQMEGGDPRAKVSSIIEEINKKESSRSATQGRRQVFTERYKEKKNELKEAERQGSRRKFDECRIRKQTMELATADLEKYHRALDQALMAFHTLKMNSINSTIKELWQQTYCGTDIDDIEIVSDSGDPKTTAGSTLRRTFNYRVQMRQGQANLDMRGRCSAGQKVLACLVIRLALAESFCTDCGILALDEPTTNLDRENIDRLAQALKRIIETRRKQRNFQLVLITHDQEFIDMIGARDHCDEYFMVFKDLQGISRARVQKLQEM